MDEGQLAVGCLWPFLTDLCTLPTRRCVMWKTGRILSQCPSLYEYRFPCTIHNIALSNALYPGTEWLGISDIQSATKKFMSGKSHGCAMCWGLQLLVHFSLTTKQLEIIPDSPCQWADEEAGCRDSCSDQQFLNKKKTLKPQLAAVHINQLPGLKAKPGILTTNRWTRRKNLGGAMWPLSCEDPRAERWLFSWEPLRTDTNSRRDANKS